MKKWNWKLIRDTDGVCFKEGKEYAKDLFRGERYFTKCPKIENFGLTYLLHRVFLRSGLNSKFCRVGLILYLFSSGYFSLSFLFFLFLCSDCTYRWNYSHSWEWWRLSYHHFSHVQYIFLVPPLHHPLLFRVISVRWCRFSSGYFPALVFRDEKP